MNLRSDAPEGRASARCLFSAKVAAFISSLGQRPRDSCNAKPPALEARFIPKRICVGLKENQCVESRLQRWSIILLESCGDAPGWHESALLALNWYSARPRRCGRETPVVNDRLIK
jgi:hypothetical protein